MRSRYPSTTSTGDTWRLLRSSDSWDTDRNGMSALSILVFLPILLRALRRAVVRAGPWRTWSAAQLDQWPSAVAGGWATVRPSPAREGLCGPDRPAGH